MEKGVVAILWIHLFFFFFVFQAIPFFITFIVLEYIIQLIQNKPRARINDSVTSLSLGLYLGCGMIIFRGLESYVYIKIYENLRIYEFNWDSAWTWYFTALAVDFGMYRFKVFQNYLSII